MTQIYNEGIEDRIGTFETRPRSHDDVRAWFGGVHPIIVVEADGQVVAFASTSASFRSTCRGPSADRVPDGWPWTR